MTPSKSALRSLAGKYFISRRGAAVSALLILVIAAADLLSPWLVMEAIDLIVAHSASSSSSEIDRTFGAVVQLAAIMIGAVLVQSLARYVLTRIQNAMIYHGAARLRSELHDRLQAQGL